MEKMKIKIHSISIFVAYGGEGMIPHRPTGSSSSTTSGGQIRLPLWKWLKLLMQTMRHGFRCVLFSLLYFLSSLVLLLLRLPHSHQNIIVVHNGYLLLCFYEWFAFVLVSWYFLYLFSSFSFFLHTSSILSRPCWWAAMSPELPSPTLTSEILYILLCFSILYLMPTCWHTVNRAYLYINVSFLLRLSFLFPLTLPLACLFSLSLSLSLSPLCLFTLFSLYIQANN